MLDPARAALDHALPGRGHRPLAEDVEVGSSARKHQALSVPPTWPVRAVRARRSHDGTVVAVVWAARSWFVHTQHGVWRSL